MPAVMRSQAMSASSWYMSWAGIGAALADQVAVQPLAGDALELAEEVELRLAVWRRGTWCSSRCEVRS